MRKGEIERATKETQIYVSLAPDGSGESEISTGIGFFDHMLTLLAAHSRFDLKVRCKGDTEVDFHHTVEDTGICLGKAFREALGDMRGINRYGSIILPMDEALVMCAADISGRAYLSYEVPVPAAKVGEFDTELAEEFILAFVRSTEITLHIKLLAGKNSHHIIEAVFKAFARTLKACAAIDAGLSGEIPSTKGVL